MKQLWMSIRCAAPCHHNKGNIHKQHDINNDSQWDANQWIEKFKHNWAHFKFVTCEMYVLCIFCLNNNFSESVSKLKSCWEVSGIKSFNSLSVPTLGVAWVAANSAGLGRLAAALDICSACLVGEQLGLISGLDESREDFFNRGFLAGLWPNSNMSLRFSNHFHPSLEPKRSDNKVPRA